MRLVVPSLLLALIANSPLHAGVTLLFEDFEDATITYTTSIADDLSDIANKDWYGRTASDTTAVPADFVYGNKQGSGFYSVHDTDGATNSTSLIQLNWTNLNIAGFTDLGLSWFVAEDADPGFPGGNWDTTTSVRIEAQIDNGGFFQIFGIEAQNNSGNELPAVDTNFDGLGDGAVITSDFTQFAHSFGLLIGSDLDIRVTIEDLDTSGEDIAFDSLHLTGTADTTGVVPEPTSIMTFGVLGIVAAFRRRQR